MLADLPDNVDIPAKAIENGFENAYSQVIDKATLTNYNDPNCEHRFQPEEGDCGIPGHIGLKCMDCPIGIIIPE